MNPDRSADIVVVGAAGFLGHRLCAAAQDRNVIGVCRSTPHRDLSGAETVIGDRRNPELVADLLGLRPSAWIDTAVNDEADIAAIAAGISLAVRRGLPLPHLVITSTFGEYSPALQRGSVITEDSPTGADDPHSEGKLKAFAALCANPLPLPVTWAILPMMWGPGDHDGTGPGGRTRLLLRRMLDTRRIEFAGTCDNPIPDGFVDTVAAALVFVAGLPGGREIRRMIVAGEQGLTPRGFVTEAAAELGIQTDIVVVPPAGSDFRPVFPGNRVVLDVSRLISTGFKAEDDWRTGVRKTARSFIAGSGTGAV